MHHTSEIYLGLVNSCIYYACQTWNCQVLPYSVGFKAPRELWNPLSKTVLSGCSFIWNKGPEMTIKLNGNLYVRPVNIFPNFLYSILQKKQPHAVLPHQWMVWMRLLSCGWNMGYLSIKLNLFMMMSWHGNAFCITGLLWGIAISHVS